MRWRAIAMLLGSAPLTAQVSMPIGIVRGNVVSRAGSTKAGEVTIRNPQNTVYGCFYDAHTYFERDHWPIAAASLVAGDPVEIVADRKPGSASCYMRTVQVVQPKRTQRLASRPAESFTPRGNMTFGGVVVRHGPQTLTIKTRGSELSLRLRADTRYLGEGLRLDPEALLVNTHVFIRGGRDIEGNLEAYQVVWGEIVR